MVCTVLGSKTVAGRATYMSVGYYYAAPKSKTDSPGALDKFLENYKKQAFDWLIKQPGVVSYHLMKDEANNRFISLSTYESWERYV